MQRRKYLTLTALTLTGCSSSTDDDDTGGNDNPDDNENGDTTTAEPVEEPEMLELEGAGETVTEEFDIQGGFTAFGMAHGGESNFQVELIDIDSGETVEYVANEIGRWQGVVPFGVSSGTYVLDVTADGGWGINVGQPRHTQDDAVEPPVSHSDEYPMYLGPVEFSGQTTFAGSYSGDSNFIVDVLDQDGNLVDLVFNEVGEFEGEASFGGEGIGYVRVRATGSWELDIS